VQHKCEICCKKVPHSAEHYCISKERPDGFWLCHPHVGRCRCAKCSHVWRPKQVKLPNRCPTCGETVDLFWADDGGWERTAKGKGLAVRSDYADDDI